jgi:hypothetical protein
MALRIVGTHLSDHTRSLAEDPSVSGLWPHARSASAKARVARGLIADGEVGGVEAAMGLELREAALEDAADQKGSLDEVGGPARLDHSRWGLQPMGSSRWGQTGSSRWGLQPMGSQPMGSQPMGSQPMGSVPADGV